MDIIQLAIILAIALFAVYKTFPDDHPLKKVAVIVVAGLAAAWDFVWPLIQGLLPSVGAG